MSKSSIITKPPIHPGAILAEDLADAAISINELARSLRVPTNRLSRIVRGERGVTADTALRLAAFWGHLGSLLDEFASALRTGRRSTHEARDCQRRASISPRELLKIPQGTHNGQKFRLREKGVLNSRTNKRGDQIVDVQVLAPVVQDERTKELLREYAQLHPEDPREAIWAQGVTP